MKRGILGLALALLLCIGITAVTPEADGYVYVYLGDMDADGSYGIYDALTVLKSVINDDPVDLADANQDGKVTLMDVLKVLKVSVGAGEPEKTAIREYYPESHLKNFSETAVSLAVGSASAQYAAEYTDGGVTVTMTVTESALSDDDYVAINLQSVNSIMEADRRCVRFICYGDGSYSLKRHLYSKGALTDETVEGATAVNDSFYYTFQRTAGGYTVTVFTSYDFLHSTEERSFGAVRLLPMLKSDGTSVTYSTLGAYYSNPETWLVLSSENMLTRDDFGATSFAADIPEGSAYKDLSFLQQLATITADEGSLKAAAVGAPAFTNRAYSFEEHFFPPELIGSAYLYAPIGGGKATVTEAGYVVLAAAENSIYDSLNTKVVAAGWEPLMMAAGSPMNNASYRSDADLVNWYVKYCAEGETVDLGKWAIPFAKGETGSFPWETTPAELILSPSDSYYALSERIWQGCPTIAVTNGGRLFASWVTGGTAEPRIENYDTFLYSDDGGKTWTELGVIETAKSTDKNKITKVNDSQLWLDAETNTLYVFYELSGMQSNFEKNCAVWMFTVDNPDAPVAEWNISSHRYCFPGLLRNNITVLSDGTWLAAPNNYMDGRFSVVYASTDKGMTWTLRGKAYIPQALNFDETVITELTDGTLRMTVRTARKAIYQSFSFDKGATWTLSSASEFANPSSRFQFFRTKSGALCAIWNDSSSARIDLKAALSYDDGKTWTDPLMIYAPRNSYPDFSIAQDGTIHVIFDSGRYKSTNFWQGRDGTTYWGAIFHIALAEERIAAGGYIEADELNTVSVCSEAPAIENRNLLPLSYLTEFSEQEITILQTAEKTAAVTYTAEYGDSGITVTATVVDPTIYTIADDIGNGDNVSIHLQAVNSIMRGDRLAINFLCDADGNYMLRRYDNSGGYKTVTEVDPTVVNDSSYFTYAKTDDGYTVTYFASYDFLRVTKEQAFGKVRMLLSLRNTDSADSTSYYVYGSEEGISYDLPNTWLVLDAENNFTRDDFDTVSFAEDILPSNAFADLQFLENLATISAGAKSTLREVKAGAQAFSDRTYSFEESYLPAELIGKAFVGGPITGDTTTVTEAGYVLLVVGELSSYDSVNTKVKNAGWTQILYAAGTPYNSAVRVNIPDLANWYVKYCEAGETINFGKWAIPFANGETTPFAWESKGAYTILDTSDSYYDISTRLWHGCPTIEATNGGRLIAAWTTGDVSEGKPGNYAVLAYSDDNGATWQELGYVNSEKQDHPDKETVVCDIQIWLDKENNVLHCFYIMSSTLSIFEKSSAVWTFTVENPDADIADWKVSEHRYLFPGLLRNNITVLSDGTWLVTPNSYLDERFTVVYASTDKGETWSLRGRAYIPEALNYDETMVTELEDGTLWLTVRANTAKKVMYQAFSTDKGYTWTMSSPSTIFNCTTRFNITRLSSGALLMVYNAASGRTRMTAALSYDDGITWPYAVTLYEASATYPDVSLRTVNGEEQIHIIFDRDRYNYGRVYHGVFTEDYIRANNGKVIDRATALNMITTLDPS